MSPTQPIGSLHHLHIPDSGYLQRELATFILLSEDQRGRCSSFGPLDLRVMIRLRDVEFPDQSYHECLHLDDAIQGVVLSVPGRVNDIRDDGRTRIATRGSS